MARTPPIIAWRNLAPGATITASSEADDGAALNAVDQATYDYWVPSEAPAWIQIDLDEPAEIECIGVAAHNIATQGASLTFQEWDGAEWVDVIRAPTGTEDNTMFALLDPPVQGDSFRFRLSGAAAIGVLWLGPVLRMQRNLYQGHTPVVFGDDSESKVNRSARGANIIGVSEVRRGRQTSIEIDNLSAPWVRDNLTGFIRHYNRGEPFFWAWHVDKYPDDVAYCWAPMGESVSIPNSGTANLMDLSLPVRAYRDGRPQPPVVFTTTLYPVEDVQALSISSTLEDGRFAPRPEISDATAVSGSVESGDLRVLVRRYTIEPPDSVSVSGSVESGALVAVGVVEYQAWPPEAVSVSGSVESGSIRVLIIRYDDYPPDAMLVSGEVIGGQLNEV